MKEFFKVENLCFGYLKKPLCLKDVNFSAGQKDKVLILALDDRGKTSLLKCLSGFEEKFFGKVFLDGKELRMIPDSEKFTSLILDYPILVNGSIDDNLNFLYGVLKKEIPIVDEKIKLLEKFGLNSDINLKVKKLTLFEKFKLCLLRTYVKNSRAIFVDDILKNNFSETEIGELIEILKDLSRDRLLVFASSEKSFLKCQSFFRSFDWSKVLYLNNTCLVERKNLIDFFDNAVDLDACLFNDNLVSHEGYCVYQDGCYYLSIEEKFVIKIDKKFGLNFAALKLENLENEDVVVVHDAALKLDFNKNNDFNSLLETKDVMVFSKLDRSRIL